MTVLGPRMSIQKILGENIKRLRQESGLSQEELAHRSGIHVTYLSGIENAHRNPAVGKIAKIALALKVEPHILLMKSE